MSRHAASTRTSSLLGSSAVMASGTIVSRISGFVRAGMLTAAIGSTGVHADAFNLANTVPNMLYILLAGGVFNAVLVPQLVRSMKEHADGGEAYANRIVTLAACFLGVITVVLVLGAPLLMHLYLDSSWYQPDHAAALSSTVAFARWCLPQVFFYGMFVLVGQILNSRGRFGPMMWAPIANNVISVAVLALYLTTYGGSASGGFGHGEEVLLGLGSTFGIVAQFLLLLPSLRAAGFRYTPRFDWRGAGLSHTFRLGIWTVLFVVANQVAYTVVTRLASGGSTQRGSGYTVYANSFLVTQVSHAVVTVSLATAVLPLLSRAAANGDLGLLGRAVTSTLRSSLSIVVPAACLLAVLATDIARLLFGWGAGLSGYHLYGPTLAVFAPGMVFFTIHYVVLRGFYALELNRTVFLIQCAVALANIVAAVLLVRAVSATHTAPALSAAYGVSYLVGSAISYRVLRRRLGDVEPERLVRFLVRLIIVTAVATAWSWVFHRALLTYDANPGKVVTVLECAGVGVVDLCVLVLGAQVLHLTELTSVVTQFGRRLGLVREG
jgi:putative peptidoglycan lipid II flippase